MTNAPPDSALSLRGLRKRYGEHVVLDGIDLDVACGERIALIGPSGSGKSTILRLVMALERPDAGTLEVEGRRVWTMRRGDRDVPADESHLQSIRRRLGMVFQHFNLFPHMRALENVALAPRLVLGLPREAAAERARACLEQVGLADKGNAWPIQLSGGQKQRVAIARALALEPMALLFDEITSALDPELVGEVLTVVRDIARDRGTSMLIVTHEMGFAREVADRVLFLDGGRIVEEGAPEQVLDAPREERTRAFLRAVLRA